jgi:hypothetical protein
VNGGSPVFTPPSQFPLGESATSGSKASREQVPRTSTPAGRLLPRTPRGKLSAASRQLRSAYRDGGADVPTWARLATSSISASSTMPLPLGSSPATGVKGAKTSFRQDVLG